MSTTNHVKSIVFAGPGEVQLRSGPAPTPDDGQVLVRAECSAISAGSEMLVYHGLAPRNEPVDNKLPDLSGDFHYPVQYGYAVVGRVIQCGLGVDTCLRDQRVFAFHPHESLFVTDAERVVPLPDDLASEDAVFAANMDTALTLTMDARPIIGERVAVCGQGVVGLLTTSLLASCRLERLATLDNYPLRRQWSRSLGANRVVDASDRTAISALCDEFYSDRIDGADLVFEISGNPEALGTAIDLTGFGGRVVIGSWYTREEGSIAIGTHFHRNRIRLISSQVSTIGPDHAARWDKSRRFNTALRLVARHQPSELITHRFPIDRGAEAYQLLDKHPGEAVQVVLTY